MFPEMRRKDRQLSQKETVRVLESALYGTISTVNEDGWPYAVPIDFVYADGKLYFHGARDGAKLQDFRRNNRVCFSAVASAQTVPEQFSTRYASAVVFGHVSELDGEEKEAALLRLIEKYCPDHLEQGRDYVRREMETTAAFAVSIEHMTGKARK